MEWLISAHPNGRPGHGPKAALCPAGPGGFPLADLPLLTTYPRPVLPGAGVACRSGGMGKWTSLRFGDDPFNKCYGWSVKWDCTGWPAPPRGPAGPRPRSSGSAGYGHFVPEAAVQVDPLPLAWPGAESPM